MISEREGVFCLSAANSTYIFRVTKFGHLEHVFYGERLPQDAEIAPLLQKNSAEVGGGVRYDESDEFYCLDHLPLEWSASGKGDMRLPPAEIRMPDGGYTADFRYESSRIFAGKPASRELPVSYGGEGECSTLEVELADAPSGARIFLYYTAFEDCAVIARQVVLKNGGEGKMLIRSLMSACLDLPAANYDMLTLDGDWIKETHAHIRPLSPGRFAVDSALGASGAQHNPAVMVFEHGADEEHGRCYGMNLVYSGCHVESAEVSSRGLLRLMTGISPRCFEWELAPGESFESPEALLTFSGEGFRGVSESFHNFINNHIVRGAWRGRARPVLYNSWEACFFDFNRARLLHLAKGAKALGAELFVLDDGWFGARDSDRAGLGDWEVNTKKLPGGLASLQGALSEMGLDFGLWVEPEMVNPESALFRSHPEWAVCSPGRKPCLGRHQLVLDLCRSEVRDYIVENLSRVLESADIRYIKWDMNRNITDPFSPVLKNQGEFYHRYILGLYDILRRVFERRPGILLEGCASGGGRFDLGMLCFAQQIWASDDTDPVERQEIQEGLSYFYPLSTIAAHVSAAPHQQTLRDTPLSTRFNTAAFGVLGYELDLAFLSPAQRKEIRAQILFYKKWRELFQFGRFVRLPRGRENRRGWLVGAPDGSAAIVGNFQGLSKAADTGDILPLWGLEPDARYRVSTLPQGIALSRFGALVNFISPVKLRPGGPAISLAERHYRLPDCVESYEAEGAVLMSGIRLNSQFMGSYYNDKTRLLGDFGSNLYLIEKILEGNSFGEHEA